MLMGKTGKFIGIALLLCVGCQLAAPTVPRFDDDPFRSALVPDFPSIQELAPENDLGEFGVHFAPSVVQFTAKNAEDTQRTQSDSVIPNEPPEDEFIYEPDDTPPMSLDEQVKLLSQNQWSKNHARINMLDTGRKSHFAAMSLEERQRWEQISQLNMSDKEREKRQSQHFDYVDGSAVDWRWMHRGVEQLYVMPPEQRVNPADILKDKRYSDQKILLANAAILLGRDGNPAVRKFLLKLVQDDKVHVQPRCAAVEVLGRMETITANDLIPLLDNVKDREIETTDRKTGETKTQRQPGNVELWEELLIAIAEKVEPWEHDCFIEPFYSSNGEIRLVAAKIWRRTSLQKQPKGTLPEKFLEMAKRESNLTVRVEIIKTLGAWQVPDLFALLERDLLHPSADIRNAAMLALADARCQEAIPAVKDQLKSTGAANRAAAVSALRKLGAFDDVFKYVDDQDAQVRIEVAKALSERCTPQTANFAKTYISDRNAKVQSAAIEAVGGWSIEESGRLLLTAMKSFDSGVRCRAAEILAGKGVSYSGFNPEDRPENQSAQFQELVHVFRQTTGVDPQLDLTGKERPVIQQASATVPENAALTEVRRCLDDWSDTQQRQFIQRRLTAHGSRLMVSIDHLLTVEKRNIPESLDRVFAEVDPMFREIEKLKSNDLTTQQRAARELAKLGAIDVPSKLAAKRIIDLSAKQTDAAVLTSLISALQNADSELVCGLARPLLQSESAQVRRMSCEMLRQSGSGEDVPLLQEMLRDPSRVVVKGALQAMDSLLKEEPADSPVFATLKTMLLQSEPDMQVAVAAILHRLGHQEGTDTFRRLAVSNDYRHRAEVARTVPELGDPVFIPLLLRFLDDSQATVKSEALKGLPKLAGQDIGRIGSGYTSSEVPQTQLQIDRWKAWGREQSGVKFWYPFTAFL